MAIAIMFIIVAVVMAARIKATRGSLRLAKASAILAALSTAGSFIFEVTSSLNQDELLVKQLYVFVDLFAMLVLAFLASFAVIATHAGPRRNLFLVLFFAMALIPPLYLLTSYNEAYVVFIEPEVFDFTAPPLTYPLYAIVGIPLGLIPIVVFIRSFMTARKRGDTVLSNRAAWMFSAVFANEAAYMIYAFGTGIVELAALVAWIPAAFLLLYAVLKITSPV
jgi:hypothetical protein